MFIQNNLTLWANYLNFFGIESVKLVDHKLLCFKSIRIISIMSALQSKESISVLVTHIRTRQHSYENSSFLIVLNRLHWSVYTFVHFNCDKKLEQNKKLLHMFEDVVLYLKLKIVWNCKGPPVYMWSALMKIMLIWSQSEHMVLGVWHLKIDSKLTTLTRTN